VAQKAKAQHITGKVANYSFVRLFSADDFCYSYRDRSDLFLRRSTLPHLLRLAVDLEIARHFGQGLLKGVLEPDVLEPDECPQLGVEVDGRVAKVVDDRTSAAEVRMRLVVAQTCDHLTKTW